MKTICTKISQGCAVAAIALTMAIPAAFAQAPVPSKDNPNNPNQLNGRSVMKKPDVSPGASVSEVIGTNNLVTINYHRPGEKGRKLWTGDDPAANSLVPHNENPKPWRAGANENTTICFQSDVKIEGKDLPAGTYGLFIIPTGGDWTIVFSKKNNNWGLNYSKADDALRVTVKPQDAPDQEWLQYTFDDLSAGAATAYMHWGTKMVGFKIEPGPEAAAPAAAPAKADDKAPAKADGKM